MKSTAEDKVIKRINDVVDQVFNRYHRTMSYREFELIVKRSYMFYNKVIALSLYNVDAVAREKFPKLICNMTSDEDFNDFLFYVDIETKKRELAKNDNHQ